MRLFLTIALVMIAFAANSVLNRLALVDGATSPGAFALTRLVAGSVFLVALAYYRTGSFPRRSSGRIWGPFSLALYVLGFSFAYVTLDAGTGALILFGGVQITMFVAAILQAERVPLVRWIGATVAFGGLVVLFWTDGAVRPDPLGSLLMLAAAIGWGVYSILGRGVKNPIGVSAANFVYAVPLALICFLVVPHGISGAGLALAVISGAITSGAGYALWYRVLPRIETSTAAVAQLTVPIIAVAGGVAFLNEPLSLRFIASAGLVISGVLISLRR